MDPIRSASRIQNKDDYYLCLERNEELTEAIKKKFICRFDASFKRWRVSITDNLAAENLLDFLDENYIKISLVDRGHLESGKFGERFSPPLTEGKQVPAQLTMIKDSNRFVLRQNLNKEFSDKLRLSVPCEYLPNSKAWEIKIHRSENASTLLDLIDQYKIEITEPDYSWLADAAKRNAEFTKKGRERQRLETTTSTPAPSPTAASKPSEGAERLISSKRKFLPTILFKFPDSNKIGIKGFKSKGFIRELCKVFPGNYDLGKDQWDLRIKHKVDAGNLLYLIEEFKPIVAKECREWLLRTKALATHSTRSGKIIEPQEESLTPECELDAEWNDRFPIA